MPKSDNETGSTERHGHMEREIYAQEEEGDDEPRPEVDAERGVELGRVEHAVGDVRVDDAGAGDEDRPERHPEAAVHRERCVEQTPYQYPLDARRYIERRRRSAGSCGVARAGRQKKIEAGKREGRNRDGDRCSPVAPNEFAHAKSHMPATNCARPPTKRAMPTTTLGVAMLRAWMLNIDRMNVVDAKPNRPLPE